MREQPSAAELIDGTRDQFCRRLGLREIDRDRGHTFKTDEAVDTTTAGDHDRAFLDEGPRDRHADPLARAGDDRDLVRQL